MKRNFVLFLFSMAIPELQESVELRGRKFKMIGPSWFSRGLAFEKGNCMFNWRVLLLIYSQYSLFFGMLETVD